MVRWRNFVHFSWHLIFPCLLLDGCLTESRFFKLLQMASKRSRSIYRTERLRDDSALLGESNSCPVTVRFWSKTRNNLKKSKPLLFSWSPLPLFFLLILILCCFAAGKWLWSCASGQSPSLSPWLWLVLVDILFLLQQHVPVASHLRITRPVCFCHHFPLRGEMI